MENENIFYAISGLTILLAILSIVLSIIAICMSAKAGKTLNKINNGVNVITNFYNNLMANIQDMNKQLALGNQNMLKQLVEDKLLRNLKPEEVKVVGLTSTAMAIYVTGKMVETGKELKENLNTFESRSVKGMKEFKYPLKKAG